MDTVSLLFLRYVCGMSNAKVVELCETGMFEQTADLLCRGMSGGLDNAERILSDAHRMGLTLLDYTMPSYPKRLRGVPNAPVVLFAQGDLSLLTADLLVAIVGTRKPSAEGARQANDVACALARHDVVVVSGLALGIDSAAHEGALRAGNRTIAVLGCGHGRIYPKPNVELRRRIEQCGLVLSELPPDTASLPSYFTARNRIITGVSDGVLVMQGGTKSGTGNAARIATEQGRVIYAVEGPVDNPLYDMPNALIRRGAVAIHTADDILRDRGCVASAVVPNVRGTVEIIEVGPAEPVKRARRASSKQGKSDAAHKSDAFDDVEVRVTAALSSPLLFDELLPKIGVSAAQLQSILTILEIKGKISCLRDMRYVAKS